MQPAIAAGLRVRLDAELGEKRLHARCGLPDLVEHDTGLRVEIDPQLIGVRGIFDAERPEVEPQTAQVDRPHDVSQVGDDECPRGRTVRRRDLDGLEPLRSTCRNTLLEERLPERAVRESLQHGRPAGCRAQDRLGDGEVVTNDIQLGRPYAGKEELVRVRDLDAAPRHLDGLTDGSAASARHLHRLARALGRPARRQPGGLRHSIASSRARASRMRSRAVPATLASAPSSLGEHDRSPA